MLWLWALHLLGTALVSGSSRVLLVTHPWVAGEGTKDLDVSGQAMGCMRDPPHPLPLHVASSLVSQMSTLLPLALIPPSLFVF